jgi:hypothetical protein
VPAHDNRPYRLLEPAAGSTVPRRHYGAALRPAARTHFSPDTDYVLTDPAPGSSIPRRVPVAGWQARQLRRQRHTSLLRVTNRGARRLLLAAYRAAGLASVSAASPFGMPASANYAECFVLPGQLRMRHELRAELERSGLAELLPGGPGNLPDLAVDCPALLLPWLRLAAPRTYEDAVRFVTQHLDCYLARKVQFPWQMDWALALAGLGLLGLMLAFITVRWTGLELNLFFPGICLLILLARPWAGRSDAKNRSQLQRLEFYLYLRERFAEPPGVPPPSRQAFRHQRDWQVLRPRRRRKEHAPGRLAQAALDEPGPKRRQMLPSVLADTRKQS